MGHPPLASLEELEVALGDPCADRAQAQSLLSRASAIVRAYAGQTWLNDAGDELQDVPPDIPGVVVSMVERATQNPAGATYQTETAGLYTLSRSYGSAAADRLYLSKWDKLIIRSAAKTGQLYTISTTRGDLETSPFGIAESDPWLMTNEP